MAWFPPPNGAAHHGVGGHGPAPSHPYRNHGGPIPSQTPPLHHHAVPPRRVPPPMMRGGVGVPAGSGGPPHHSMMSVMNRDARNCSLAASANPYGAQQQHRQHPMMMENQQAPPNRSRYAYAPPPNAAPSMPQDVRTMRGLSPRMGPNHMAPFPANVFRGAPPPPPAPGRPMIPPPPHHASSSSMMMRMNRSCPTGPPQPPMHHVPPIMRRQSDRAMPPPSRNVAPTMMHAAPPSTHRESPVPRLVHQPTNRDEATPSPPPLRESRQHNVASASASPATSSGAVTKSTPSPAPSSRDTEGKSFPTETSTNPPAPSREQDAASILLGLRNTIISSAIAKKGPSLLSGPQPTTVERTSSQDSSCTATTEHSVPSLASSSSTTRRNPNSNSYPTRLSLPGDEVKLNSMHCFLRSELLELFVVDTSKPPKEALGCSASGRVGLRCVHCHMARRRPNASSADEAPMAVFYPKSLSEIYRLVTSWQRVHLRKCKSLPPSVRSSYQKLKEGDKTRGKTQYWIDAAMDLGLVDCPSKAGGIRFAQFPTSVKSDPPHGDDIPCSTVTLPISSPSSLGLYTSQ